MKDKLVGNIMAKFVALRPKTYSHLMDDDSEAKKAKETKNCVMKRMYEFLDYKDFLFNKEAILRPQRFKSQAHEVCTEEVNKIALSSNDDKRLQNYDKITSVSAS